jgi:hypothetical protein
MLTRRILKLGKDDPSAAWHLVMDLPAAEEIPKFVLDSEKKTPQPAKQQQ